MTIRTPIKYTDIVTVSVPESNGLDGLKIASLKSKIAVPVGSFFLSSPLVYPKSAILPKKDFTTVQVQDIGHFQFDNEFEYMNHSCDPSAALLVLPQPDGSVHVNIRAIKAISPGDDITFFYPSTEWDMDEPFACRCKDFSGGDGCISQIGGAKYIDRDLLVKNKAKWGISDWIIEAKNAK